MERVQEEVRTICEHGLADLLLFAHEVGQFCSQHGVPLAARGSATASLVVWTLGLSDLCPLDYGLDGRMFVHTGREDLPDLDLEVSSLHEQAVSAFVQQGGFEGLPAHAAGEFPHLRAIRVGVHVSMGARQAVRAVGGALGMEAPRVNTVARQVPLLSSPGAIENVMMRGPELASPTRVPASSRTTRSFAWQVGWKACRSAMVPTRPPTRSRSTGLASWTGCQRTG